MTKNIWKSCFRLYHYYFRHQMDQHFWFHTWNEMLSYALILFSLVLKNMVINGQPPNGGTEEGIHWFYWLYKQTDFMTHWVSLHKIIQYRHNYWIRSLSCLYDMILYLFSKLHTQHIIYPCWVRFYVIIDSLSFKYLSVLSYRFDFLCIHNSLTEIYLLNFP